MFISSYFLLKTPTTAIQVQLTGLESVSACDVCVATVNEIEYLLGQESAQQVIQDMADIACDAMSPSLSNKTKVRSSVFFKYYNTMVARLSLAVSRDRTKRPIDLSQTQSGFSHTHVSLDGRKTGL